MRTNRPITGSLLERLRVLKRARTFIPACVVVAALVTIGILVAHADATARLWCSSGGSAWLTTGNWTGGVPSGAEIGQFGANPTSGTTGVGINMGGSTNNGSNNQVVGAIEVTS